MTSDPTRWRDDAEAAPGLRDLLRSADLDEPREHELTTLRRRVHAAVASKGSVVTPLVPMAARRTARLRPALLAGAALALAAGAVLLVANRTAPARVPTAARSIDVAVAGGGGGVMGGGVILDAAPAAVCDAGMCGGAVASAARAPGEVRFVNLFRGLDDRPVAVDVWLVDPSGQPIRKLVEQLPFGAVSGWHDVPAGVQISAASPGGDIAHNAKPSQAEPGTRRTVLLRHGGGGPNPHAGLFTDAGDALAADASGPPRPGAGLVVLSAEAIDAKLDAAMATFRIGLGAGSCATVRHVRAGDGRARPAQLLGETGRAEVELAPGKHLLTLHAVEDTACRAPVLTREIEVVADSTTWGFVHSPDGKRVDAVFVRAEPGPRVADVGASAPPLDAATPGTALVTIVTEPPGGAGIEIWVDGRLESHGLVQFWAVPGRRYHIYCEQSSSKRIGVGEDVCFGDTSDLHVCLLDSKLGVVGKWDTQERRNPPKDCPKLSRKQADARERVRISGWDWTRPFAAAPPSAWPKLDAAAKPVDDDKTRSDVRDGTITPGKKKEKWFDSPPGKPGKPSTTKPVEKSKKTEPAVALPVDRQGEP
jgi:hypothetical protein